MRRLPSASCLEKTLAELGVTEEIIPAHTSVKEAVFPFNKFPGTDILLGPEMRSTGEVMGIGTSFGLAYAKAELGASQILPQSGTVFISVNDRDKADVVPIAQGFTDLGFKLIATAAPTKPSPRKEFRSACAQNSRRSPSRRRCPKNQEIQLVINSPIGVAAQEDDRIIRRSALEYKIPIVTTIAGAKATLAAIQSLKESEITVKALQDYLAYK